MMQRLIPVLFLFVCQITFGQNNSLNTFISWFSKSDKASIQSYFDGHSYRLLDEKDSLDFHTLHYSLVKTEQGLQLHSYLLLKDSLTEFISFETVNHAEQQSIFAQLKAARFKLLTTDINGNFITSTYDNGVFLIHEDYEAIVNPIGKGEIAYYRYRIIRKNGKFDAMNGEKTVLASESGASYIGIRESYKNGLLEGERIYYFPNGTVKRKENYRTGRLNGLVSDFNAEGKLIHSSTHSYHWKYGMEKWYNSDGKVVKTMQWQRDLPVGIQKQTFDGTVVESIPYVKGVKQGLAKVPVYFEEFADSINTEPLGIETVTYQDNLKTGKGVCIRFGSNDTLYVANYKAGKLDSTYRWYQQSMQSYYKNVPRYTATFADGLEHGTRVYVITAGPLKDSIYQTESYKNGKLDGLVVQYYKKNEDKSPEFVPGEWYANYSFETYEMGVRNGPFLFREDSVKYSRGTYVDGKLDGLQEAAMVLDGKWIKTTGYYQDGLKSGEWKNEYLQDSVLVTEHYERGLKQGAYTKVIKGFKTEERLYDQDTLRQVTFFDQNSDFESFSIELIPNAYVSVPNSVIIHHKSKKKDSSSSFSYAFKTNEDVEVFFQFMADSLRKENELTPHLSVPFTVTTSNYEIYGNFNYSKWDGEIEITHLKDGIFERSTYQNGHQLSCFYTQIVVCEDKPYTGTFISAQSGEKISVKDGLRNGWSIEYDDARKEIRRTKYSKGIAKKTADK